MIRNKAKAFVFRRNLKGCQEKLKPLNYLIFLDSLIYGVSDMFDVLGWPLVHRTGLLPLNGRHWMYLDIIF